MTNISGIRWVTPPSKLIEGIEAYGKKALIAVYAVAVYWGQKCQDTARSQAAWTDRTGNARSGLFFAVDGFGQQAVTGTVTPGAATEMSDAVKISGNASQLVIALGHTVWYGKFLETAHGGRNAIVMSTIEANLPTLEKTLKEVFA
jgi:hypothetical protein